MPHPRRLAILIFDDVELLDFAGPFEVFNVTGRDADPPPFQVRLVAASPEGVLTRGKVRVIPHQTLDECDRADLLLIPGGYGTRRLLRETALHDWIRTRADQAELVMSVCTGSLLLAKCGLLDGLEATTHHSACDLLKLTAPNTNVRKGVRFVDNGRIITSAGIAAGIDMSLHVVARLLGDRTASETASYMEYPWKE